MATQAPSRRRQLARGVQTTNQNADRAAIGGHCGHAAVGVARLRPDQHAQDRWLALACYQAHRSRDRSCRMIETIKKGVLRYRTPLEKLTSGFPKGSPSRPERCLNANRQSDSFMSLEIALRFFYNVPAATE